MLRYSIGFFVVAIVAAALGFGGIAGGATDIAKLLFVGFLILAVVTTVMNFLKKAA